MYCICQLYDILIFFQVSAILSEPLEQSPMAFPDYDQVLYL